MTILKVKDVLKREYLCLHSSVLIYELVQQLEQMHSRISNFIDLILESFIVETLSCQTYAISMITILLFSQCP